MSNKLVSFVAFLALAISLPLSGSAIAQEPVEKTNGDYAVTCYVRATAIGLNSMGYTCSAYSDWHSNQICIEARNAAEAEARERLPANCNLVRVVYDCVPRQFCTCCDQTQVAPMRSSECVYEITYRLRCCNGQLLTYTVKDPDYCIAKKRAKDAVCFWASLECDSQVRCLCWTMRRVPG